MPIIVSCKCGKQFKVKEELAGKRGKCAACGQVLTVPTLTAPTLTPSVEIAKATPAPQRSCPSCREALQPTAVICTKCGLDTRTGKEIPQAKFFVPTISSRPTSRIRASSLRSMMALIAGGVCLAIMAVAVTNFSRAKGPQIPGIAPQPKPGAQNDSPLAEASNLLAHTNRADAGSATGGVIDNPPAETQLSPEAQNAVLSLVYLVKDAEQLTNSRRRTDQDLKYALMGRNDNIERAAEDVVKHQCEMEAILALLKVISDKRSSQELHDQTACANAVRALGCFGPKAKNAVPVLAELVNHSDTLVAGDAADSLKKALFAGTDSVVDNRERSDFNFTTGGTTNDPPALKNLIAKVTAISPDDVAVYEQFLRDPTFFNATLYQGTLPYTGDDVREAINVGLEKSAVSALVKLIQERKSSTDKADLLVCAQCIKALGHFGALAMEANSLLNELQNYEDNAIGTAAKLAFADINGIPQSVDPPSDTVPPPAETLPSAEAQDAVRRLVEVVVGAEKLAKARGRSEQDILFAWVDQKISIDGAVESVVKVKCEPDAIRALLKVISEKQSSRELVEQTACGNAVRALGCFGQVAKDAAPVLAELVNHHDRFVAGEARECLDKIQFGRMADEPSTPTAKSGVAIPRKKIAQDNR